MAAKNAAALRILNQKVKDRETHKFYLCVVCGHLKEKDWPPFTGYLEKKRRPQNRVERVPAAQGARSRPSAPATGCWRSAGASPWWRWSLLTGRTHQIRAHFASIGHPLAGDGKYGKNAVNRARAELPLIRRCTPTSCGLTSRRTAALCNTCTGGSSPRRTCGFCRSFTPCPAWRGKITYNRFLRHF